MRKQAARAQRFRLQVPAKVRVVGSELWMDGITADVSSTGVLLRDKAGALPPGVAVEIVLQLSTLKPYVADLWCQATVVRVVPQNQGAQVAVRIADYRLNGAMGDRVAKAAATASTEMD